MNEVIDMGDGTFRCECPEEGCGAFTQGSDATGVQYTADQHTLSHTQEWAPSAEILGSMAE